MNLPCRAVWENFLLVEQMSHFNTYETNKHSNAKYYRGQRNTYLFYIVLLVHLYLVIFFFKKNAKKIFLCDSIFKRPALWKLKAIKKVQKGFNILERPQNSMINPASRCKVVSINHFKWHPITALNLLTASLKSYIPHFIIMTLIVPLL